jgi:dTMP kinase
MKIASRFSGLKALFGTRDFRRLCISQIFGGMGEWLATMALITLVWDRTHSAFASGIVLALRILPAAVISSFLSMIVDRFDRRRVLVACTLGRACIYGSLPLVSGVAPVLALALLAEVGTLAYMAARDATLPRLVPPEHLSTANAISMASAFGSMPIGSGIFAGLVWLQHRSGHAGVGLPLIAAAVMLFGATLLIGRIQNASGVPVNDAPVADAAPKDSRAQRAALRQVLRDDPILARVVLGAVVVACAGGSLLTLGLAYVRGTLHAGPAAYSGLLTTFCAGAVTGVVALQKAREHLPKIFHLGAAAMGAILLAMALFPSTAIGYAMGFVFGGAFVATFLGGITILQDRVDDAVRGRAFAIAHSGLRVGAVGVGLLAAWAAKAMGSGHVVGLMDGTQVVLGIAGFAMFATAAMLVRPMLGVARARA